MKGAKQGESGVKVLAVNRKARQRYSVEERMESGIELKGTEVKSMRGARFSFGDAYARIEGSEVWLHNLNISAYEHGNIHNHDPERPRRLLLHKQEIKRLKRKVDEKGLTMVPLRFYLKKGIVKLELGLCRGKKLYDRREEIKKRDQKLDAEREARHSFR